MRTKRGTAGIKHKTTGSENNSLAEGKEKHNDNDCCMSALAEHAIHHHHNIAWEDATVVDTEPHMYLI